eukprot:Sspe_Gene.115507::Locus_103052_Transcript_2_3_Confidence_0.333_Length_517::g.115507::m.115507
MDWVGNASTAAGPPQSPVLAACVSDGHLVIVGGHGDGSTPVSTVRLDEGWVPVRARGSAPPGNTHILAWGVRGEGVVILWEARTLCRTAVVCSILDASRLTWETTESPLPARRGMSVVCTPRHSMLLFGGYGAEREGEVLEYRPERG